MTKVRFEARPYFRQWWMWLLIGLMVVLGWAGLIEQIVLGQPFGTNPGPDWLVWLMWLLVGIGLPLLFLWLHLRLAVTDQEIEIDYRPFSQRRIPLSTVLGATAREYDALREYGGWGIKGWSRDKRAYNVSGNAGVELFLIDGRSVMLGSRRADELERAIMEAKDALP